MQVFLKGLAVPFIILLLWFVGSSFWGWNSYIIPSPQKTLQTFDLLIDNGMLLKHMGTSLYRVFAGFFIALLIGLPLGIFLGMNTRYIAYYEPILEFIRHIPPLAMIPMLILWFGIGEASKLVVIVLAAFFPIFLNTFGGVRRCDLKLLEVGTSLGFTPGQQFFHIILPAAFPDMLVGMQLALGYSWRALVGAELIAASAGIGYMILDAEQLSRPDIVLIGILTIGIFGAAIDFFFFRAADLLKFRKAGERAQNGWG